MNAQPLTSTQLHAFATNGFVGLRKRASLERVQALRAAVDADLAGAIEPAEYEADLNYPGAPASRDAPGGATVRRLLQAHARHFSFAQWAAAPEVTEPLRQLLGPEVMLSQAHHNCVMTKQPRFSSATRWHQDIRYWSFQRPELVSVWLALSRETAENGCLSFLPGSHTMQFARERFDDALFLREDLPETQALMATRVSVELEAGDVVLFHCRTLHSAGSNRSSATKLSLVFTYHAARNAALPGTRSAALPSLPV
jgi:phytanoyl-CoA hydroxylase